MNDWHIPDAGPGRTVQIKGEEYLYFSGTSYLGLHQHKLFKALLQEGIERFGANFGGSRRSNLRFDLYHKAEALFCEWTGAPAALLFSSGTLAGQVLHRIMRTLGQVLYAPGTHPALWGASHLPTLDFRSWSLQLQEQLAKRQETCVIFANSIDPLKSQAYDLEWAKDIPDGPLVYLVVDDSHGFGVMGEEGMGVYESLQTPPWVRRVILASLGKAFSLPAGIVLGDKDIIERCWESPFFGGASPLPPAYLYALLERPSLWKEQLTKLRGLISYFDRALEALPIFQHLPSYPVYYCKNNELADQLWKERIMIASFPYPRPADPVITRIIIHALHQREDLDKLIRTIKSGL